MKVSLVFIYIIVVKTIILTFQKQPPEVVPEVKGKPATRGKNLFIIDIGRALHLSVVLTELP